MPERKNGHSVEHPVPEFTVPPNSEEGLALAFAERNKDRLRYVPKWGWGSFDGKIWSFEDSRLAARRLIREFVREKAGTLTNDLDLSKKIVAWHLQKNIERLAEADNQHLRATTDQWDQDDWLLNTPDGVVDLRDGKLGERRADDYCTKIAAVGPGADKPKLWLEFLNRITNGDKELQSFLKRVCGYCLTGSTREQTLFFCWGTGANGKSVFIETIAHVLGDYAAAAGTDVFTDTGSYTQHPTGIAKLRGARMVRASETEEGRRWKESLIKQLTGQDKISARFMRQDFFEFMPQFKLIMVGNHKPELRSVGHAMRRRLKLIPFTQTIPVSERDTRLSAKLKKEAPGILRWMIDGCLEWKRDGLDPPDIVEAATADYFEEEDSLGSFIASECQRSAQAEIESTALFSEWKEWAERNNEYVGTQKSFTNRMIERQFERRRGSTGRWMFKGITTAAAWARSQRPRPERSE